MATWSSSGISHRSTNTLKEKRQARNILTRFKSLRKKSKKRVKLAIQRLMREPTKEVPVPNASDTLCHPDTTKSTSESLSRSSVNSIRSYRDLRAYNRVSTLSIPHEVQEMGPSSSSPPKRYTLHLPDNDGVSFSSSSTTTVQPILEHHIEYVFFEEPSSFELETALAAEGQIAPNPTFALSPVKEDPQESWEDFLERNSVIEPTRSGSDSSSRSWGSEIESATIEAAQVAHVVTGAVLVRFVRRGKRVLAKSTSDMSCDVHADAAPISDVARPKVSQCKPSTGVMEERRSMSDGCKAGPKRVNTPYQTYNGPFELVTYSAPDLTVGRNSCCGTGDTILLPLVYIPNSTAACVQQPVFSSKRPGPAYQCESSWLDLTDDEEREESPSSSSTHTSSTETLEFLPSTVYVPPPTLHTGARQTVVRKTVRHPSYKSEMVFSDLNIHRFGNSHQNDIKTGYVTRSISNAKDSVPRRVVMTDNYPFFLGSPRSITRPRHNRSQSQPLMSLILKGAVASTLQSPPPSTQAGNRPPSTSVVTHPARNQTPSIRLVLHRNPGYLSRKLTNAHPHTPGRALMVDSHAYPILSRSSRAAPHPPLLTKARHTRTRSQPQLPQLQPPSRRALFRTASQTKPQRPRTMPVRPSPLRQSVSYSYQPSSSLPTRFSISTVAEDGASVTAVQDTALARNDEALSKLQGESVGVRQSEARQRILRADIERLCVVLGF